MSQNYVMYKIVCNDLNIIDSYVGHTTNFNIRKSDHKYNCNTANRKKYSYKVYQSIRVNGGWDNWSMIEIEKFICTDKYEACKRERYWIETLNATLNMVIPSRTKKEYYQKKILLKKQNIKQLEIEKLKLELEELEREFQAMLKH